MKKGFVYNFEIKMDNINSIRVGGGWESFNYFIGDTGFAIGNNHTQVGVDVKAFGVPLFGSLYDYALNHECLDKPAKYATNDSVIFSIDLIRFEFRMKKNNENEIRLLRNMNQDVNWVALLTFYGSNQQITLKRTWIDRKSVV